jgi:hypothetical protein
MRIANQQNLQMEYSATQGALRMVGLPTAVSTTGFTYTFVTAAAAHINSKNRFVDGVYRWASETHGGVDGEIRMGGAHDGRDEEDSDSDSESGGDDNEEDGEEGATQHQNADGRQDSSAAEVRDEHEGRRRDATRPLHVVHREHQVRLARAGPTKHEQEQLLSAPDDIRGTVVDMVGDKAVQRMNLDTSEGNERIEAMPDKRIVFGEKERKDFTSNASTSQRREADLFPQSLNAALFKRVTTFKTDTANEEKGVATTNIKANKAHITKPMGSDLSGRNVPIKMSGAVTKKSAIDDGMLYNNDLILERGATINEPLRAPKSALPDYALLKVNASRGKGEFRKR